MKDYQMCYMIGTAWIAVGIGVHSYSLLFGGISWTAIAFVSQIKNK